MEQICNVYGSIERITFHNEENGFCVLKVSIKNKRDTITITGYSSQVIAGEHIEASGFWINDKVHGQQFKANDIKISLPNTIDGIKKYLSSKLIKGIGPVRAKLLVDTYKEGVLNVLDNEPERIKELSGIGTKLYNTIISSWKEQRIIRNIMMFLNEHGIGTVRAVKIYKTYGEKTIEKLKENPYILSLDIYGIGFKTSDKLAKSLGINNTSILRAEAGIRHVLSEHSTSGHCAIEPQDLINKSIEILETSSDIIQIAIQNEIENKRVIEDKIDNISHIYIAPLYYAEHGIVSNIKRLMGYYFKLSISDYDLIKLANTNNKIAYSDSQINAILMTIKNKVSIITGGPGVGKTTIIKGIIQIATLLNKKITLCAPTGRAAKRLSESSQLEAKTIHRLLEFKKGDSAKFNAANKLNTDFIIIDETSMVDVLLMNNLLKAIPDHSQLLFVGDIDQLPSVGPGNVLGDMINSEVIPTKRLTEIFRQAKTSKIITNAHLINKGMMPYYENKLHDDFFFIALDDPEDIINRLLSIISIKLPQLYKMNPFTDIQVLVPMNKGTLGVKYLNSIIQKTLNSNIDRSIMSMGITYMENDKVIQTKNNYDKDVFNGDIGFIEKIDLEDELVTVNYDGKLVEYSKTDLDEIDLAYAISIHKSQGSEYPVVIIPVTTQHYTLLERNLLYTGITRGKKLVILIGQKKALYLGIKKISSSKRTTSLMQKLQSI